MYLVFYRLFRKNPNAQQSNHENQGTGQSLLILDEIKHQDMHDMRAAQVTELNLASIVTGRKVNILQMINFCCKNIIFVVCVWLSMVNQGCWHDKEADRARRSTQGASMSAHQDCSVGQI